MRPPDRLSPDESVKRKKAETNNTISHLIKTALGEEKAGLVVLNGSLVNVYTGQIQEHCSVAITGTKIASVGDDLRHLIGNDTHVIDARGQYIAPGFIDPHTIWTASSSALNTPAMPFLMEIPRPSPSRP